MFTARTLVPEGIYNNSIAVKICKHVHGKAHLPVLHTMKMNDLLMHVTTWMSLRRLILSQSEDFYQAALYFQGPFVQSSSATLPGKQDDSRDFCSLILSHVLA